MEILLLDNYDSFTYNLVQYFRTISGVEVNVFRNTHISLGAIEKFDAIVLSPGPGLPADAGIMPALIKRYAPTKPILGICLGMQAIAESFGGDLYNLEKVYHGVKSNVNINGSEEPMFNNLGQEFMAGRYHSWAVNRAGFPESLNITAEDEEGVIMGLRHKKYNVSGLQFHPESIMTTRGLEMIQNWVMDVRTKNKTLVS